MRRGVKRRRGRCGRSGRFDAQHNDRAGAAVGRLRHFRDSACGGPDGGLAWIEARGGGGLCLHLQGVARGVGALGLVLNGTQPLLSFPAIRNRFSSEAGRNRWRAGRRGWRDAICRAGTAPACPKAIIVRESYDRSRLGQAGFAPGVLQVQALMGGRHRWGCS